jgi:hypothetical protein
LSEGEQRRPVELKVGQYPGWQKLAHWAASSWRAYKKLP